MMDQEERRPHFRTGIHARGRLWTKFVNNLEMIFLFICFLFLSPLKSFNFSKHEQNSDDEENVISTHKKKGVLIRERRNGKAIHHLLFRPKFKQKIFFFKSHIQQLVIMQLIKYLCVKNNSHQNRCGSRDKKSY